MDVSTRDDKHECRSYNPHFVDLIKNIVRPMSSAFPILWSKLNGLKRRMINRGTC